MDDRIHRTHRVQDTIYSAYNYPETLRHLIIEAVTGARRECVPLGMVVLGARLEDNIGGPYIRIGIAIGSNVSCQRVFADAMEEDGVVALVLLTWTDFMHQHLAYDYVGGG
jgi:hypothetical protein